MPTDDECSKCKNGNQSGGFLYNAVIFIILILVLVLCGYNITAYTDIISGNISAPDISKGTCVALIFCNAVIIIGCIVAVFLTIKKAYVAARDSGEEYLEKNAGDVREFYKAKENAYVANTFGVQLGLFLFSSFAMFVTLMNLIQMMKLGAGDNPDAADPSMAFIIFNWFVFFLALGYWLYVSFRTLFPKKTQYQLIAALQNPVKSGLVEKAKGPVSDNKPTPAKTALELSLDKSRALGIKGIGNPADPKSGLGATFTI
jgi:hypothetical protein